MKFHKGMDYAVVMLPLQSTEDALCRLYGEDREVTKFGNLFAASNDLLVAAKRAMNVLKAQGETVREGNVLGALHAAIKKAEGATQ